MWFGTRSSAPLWFRMKSFMKWNRTCSKHLGLKHVLAEMGIPLCTERVRTLAIQPHPGFVHLSPSPATSVFMYLSILLKTDMPGQNTARGKHDACRWLCLEQLFVQRSSASFVHSLQCTKSEYQSQHSMQFILHSAASLSPARHSRAAFTPAMLQPALTSC